MTEHSKFSPSKADRWTRCPGSIEAESHFPDIESEASKEGTLAHEYVHAILTNQPAPEVSHEMKENVQGYIDYCREKSFQSTFHFFEKQLDLSHIAPGFFGTADFVSVKDKTLYVCDLKYGRVEVKPYYNQQLMIYALGAVYELIDFCDIEGVYLSIFQPKIDKQKPAEFAFDLCEASVLDFFEEFLKEKIADAMRPGAPRIAGEIQCRYCRAKATCPALKKYIFDKTVLDFSDENHELLKPELLALSDITEVLDKSKLLTSFLDSVKKYAMEKIESGEYTDYEIRERVYRRAWQDEQKVIDALGSDAYDSIISVAQCEKKLGKKRFENMFCDNVITEKSKILKRRT